MIKINSIALTAALCGFSGYADAAGCHPAFSGSATYGPGDWVSASSTVETTEACTCGTTGCPTPTGQTTGCEKTTTTTEVHNYQCASGANSAFCSQAGFEPAGQFSDSAWTKESAVCSGVVTPTPPPTPAVWSSESGCPGAYVSGTDYEPTEKVSVAGATHTDVYECAAAPNNLFCGKSGYEPGTGQYWETVWTALGSCSGSMSPTASPNFSTLTDAGGCPDAWEAGVNKYEENDKVSKNGLVFQCAAFPFSGFCGQTGYEPMPDDGTEYWKDAWTVVGYCSGTISPTASPSFDPANHVGGCPEEWVGGTNTAYEEGDMVSITVSTSPLQKIAYTCKAWPFSGFCGLYAPNSGLPDDQQGWTMNGGCTGTIAPTTAPSFGTLNLVAGGCPQDYDENNLSGIEAGDQVSLVVSAAPTERRVVYECKSGAVSAYCSNAAFIPGGQYSAMAWDLKGYCDGTISPTAAPTAYINADQPTAPAQCTSPATVKECYFEKDVTTTGVTCTCSDADCPNPDGLTGNACKKDVTVTTCPSVDAYSSSATYEAGDVVRIGTKKFQCKAWPYYLWCGNSAYEPSLEAGVWTDAWSEIGDCP
ncbi:hypothetical protein THAOC_20308 [Thalassiosira oceanica]|uniref:Chitin-binding type-3 domain-containing protein n=1 Tax=Thalassiosira oceanica TaxID=159749 RepID=K0SEU1_THAOC|nr:hypothetical protein THAOC_20308 [Thalassiosira oceanica]|eukprot:EJK59466.1 hypothetical protein THAOC_20308 [Thalassiosira oceanica]